MVLLFYIGSYIKLIKNLKIKFSTGRHLHYTFFVNITTALGVF